MKHLAIDIYQGDGVINFELMNQTSVTYVIHKVSQGTTLDNKFKENFPKILDNPRWHPMGYHYYDWRIPNDQIASDLLKLTMKQWPDIPIIIDCEFVKVRNPTTGALTNLTPPKNYEDRVRWFIEEMAKDHSIYIYSNAYFFDLYCKNGLYWAYHYPLWVAHYKSTAPFLPVPWADYWAWQFTDRGPGKKFGLQSLMADLSYVNGP